MRLTAWIAFRRLYGNAGHSDECAGHAKRAGTHGRADPCFISHSDEHGLRALYSVSRHAAYEKGRAVILPPALQPILHNRYGGGLARVRNELRCSDEGHKIDGVYSADPKKDKDAERYDNLSYMEVLSKDLKVMDASAVSLSRETAFQSSFSQFKNPVVSFRSCKAMALAPLSGLIGIRGRYEH